MYLLIKYVTKAFEKAMVVKATRYRSQTEISCSETTISLGINEAVEAEVVLKESGDITGLSSNKCFKSNNKMLCKKNSNQNNKCTVRLKKINNLITRSILKLVMFF